MLLLRSPRCQQLVTGLDLDQALATPALLLAARGNSDVQGLGDLEQGGAERGDRLLAVDLKATAHEVYDSAAARLRCGASRLNSSTALPASAA